VRKRFWFEVATSALALTIFVATVFWPDWIELCFGVDPDGGDGSAEWVVVAISAAFTIVAFTIASKEWRRTYARQVVLAGKPNV
jgi:hypothetical protein